MLGHKSLEQTTTYLIVTLTGLEESMRRFDKSVARCTTVAQTEAIELAPACNDAAEQAHEHPVN